MTNLLLIHFAFVATLSLIMFQFPTHFGLFRSSWMQTLRFVQPLSFFLFLNIPLILVKYKYDLAYKYYAIAYGLAFIYFALASLKDKKIGFNFITALMILSLLTTSYFIYERILESK